MDAILEGRLSCSKGVKKGQEQVKGFFPDGKPVIVSSANVSKRWSFRILISAHAQVKVKATGY